MAYLDDIGKIFSVETKRWVVSSCSVNIESELANRFVMEVATALQLPLGSSDEVVMQLTNYLRRREMLLIIDNFEHVWNTRSQLTALLKNAPNCTAHQYRITFQHRFATSI